MMAAPQTPQPPQPIDLNSLPKLHNVALVRTRKLGRIVIDNVPPECFIVDPNAKSINESFAGYKFQRTLSELREAGYDNVDDLESDLEGGGDPDLNQEVLVRDADHDLNVWNSDQEYGDPSTRKIWVTCIWIKLDVDGDGIAEWRKIIRAGNRILENVPSTEPPLALITPIIQPHQLIGKSLSELTIPIQRVRTSLIRAMIDNVSLSVNNRLIVDPTKVNMDDLLENRPGGIVRVQGGANTGAIESMPGASGDMASAANLLASVDDMRNERTGISKYSQGIDSDAINATATGIENITARADARLKSIVRTFAETGVKDLFRIVQRFLSQFQDEAMVVKLRGKWTSVDPRAWKNNYSLSCTVGLGTGDKTKTVQHLMQLGQLQQQGLAIGIATPANLYYTAGKLANALGYQNEESFFTDPSTVPPKQPQPDPQLALIQAQSQAENSKLQMQSQLKIAEMNAKARIDELAAQREQEKAAADIKLQALLETHKAQLVDARERDKAAADQQAERERMILQATIEREKVIWTKGTTAADEAAAFQTIQQSLQDQQ